MSYKVILLGGPSHGAHKVLPGDPPDAKKEIKMTTAAKKSGRLCFGDAVYSLRREWEIPGYLAYVFDKEVAR